LSTRIDQNLKKIAFKCKKMGKMIKLGEFLATKTRKVRKQGRIFTMEGTEKHGKGRGKEKRGVNDRFHTRETSKKKHLKGKNGQKRPKCQLLRSKMSDILEKSVTTLRQAQGPPFDKLRDHPSTGSGCEKTWPLRPLSLSKGSKRCHRENSSFFFKTTQAKRRFAPYI
jgi:hypothetical protein